MDTNDLSANAGHVTIIKRKKVVKGGGHHGGAWKVAYADFVTAMMAFFLLMWLLNATTEQQRKGLADYFNPTIPISRISGGGSDGLNGSSIFTEQTYARVGTGTTRADMDRSTGEAQKKEGSGADQEEIAKNLEGLKAELQKEGGQLSEHLAVKLSPEGITLELVESDARPLFASGVSTPTPLLSELLIVVSKSFASFENNIKIVGHTDGQSFKDNALADNWTLSSDRANAARRMLIADGVDASRIREVSGKADTQPLIPDNPLAAQNRRISIVILTN